VGLSNFGSRGRPAVPEILKMFSDQGMVGSSSITHTGGNRVVAHRPGKGRQTFGGGGSDADELPNGVTTEALKAHLLRQAGDAHPAGQNPFLPSPNTGAADPRPRLTLYRGASAPEAKEHFLGHFEVLDLPSSANLNISTLCVVATDRSFFARGQ